MVKSSHTKCEVTVGMSKNQMQTLKSKKCLLECALWTNRQLLFKCMLLIIGLKVHSFTHLAGLWYWQRKSKRSSGTGALLSFGSMVQNGKFSADA